MTNVWSDWGDAMAIYGRECGMQNWFGFIINIKDLNLSTRWAMLNTKKEAAKRSIKLPKRCGVKEVFVISVNVYLTL